MNHYTLSDEAYEAFCKKFFEGDFGDQRFGQALYNHFELNKSPTISRDGRITRLYNEKDLQNAISLTHTIFDIM